MMMDHHIQIPAGEQHKKKKTTNSNMMIGTDEANSMNNNIIINNPDSSLLFGAATSTTTIGAQSIALLDDDVFDKIEMDFDAIMSNDLDTPTIALKDNNNNDGNILSDAGIAGSISTSTNINIDSNSNSNSNNISTLLFDKLFSSPGSQGEGSKIGISSKLGNIGDELHTDLNLEDMTLSNPTTIGNKNTNPAHFCSNDSLSIASFGGCSMMGGASLGLGASGTTSSSMSTMNRGQGSDLSMDKLFNSNKEGNNSDSSIEKLLGNLDTSIDNLLNMDIIDIDDNDNNHHNHNHNDTNDIITDTNNITTNNSNSNNNNSRCNSLTEASRGIAPATDSERNYNNETVTTNTPIGNGTDNYSAQQDLNLVNVLSSSPTSSLSEPSSSVAARQHHYSMLIQQQQQQQPDPIRSIVNNQLSQLPENNQLTQMGAAGLEREKMKLVRRLQEIERSGLQGMGMGASIGVECVTGQPIQQPQQQQFQYQQQLQLQRQQQSLLQQQQQQQQVLSTSTSMPMTKPSRTNSAGSFMTQHQEQDQHQQGMARPLSPTPIRNIVPTPMMTSSNINISSNSNSNSNNMTSNMSIASVMAAGRKETPLQSFLRNKRGSAASKLQHDQQQSSTTTRTNTLGAVTSIGAQRNNNSDIKNSVLDATPLDFSSTSTNPFLRRQMMSNLERSVNRNSRIGGRLSGSVNRGGLSSSVRQSMIHQMSSGNNLRASSLNMPSSLPSTTQNRGKATRRNSNHITGHSSKITTPNMLRRSSSDFYESAGILSRHASEDHIAAPSRRTSIGAGAAKAQNRRFTLSRSNSSFGNLTKNKLIKVGSQKSLSRSNSSFGNLMKNNKHGSRRELIKVGSQSSFGSHDSSGSLIPTKRGGGRGAGSGSKYRLGGGGNRSHSVPYMVSSKSNPSNNANSSAHQGNKQNDSWL